MTTTLQKPKKSSKVTTTVRFDADLKRRAEEYARANHMDFTTFLSFSIANTMKNGGSIEPEMTDEKYAYYQKMVEYIESGDMKTEKFDSLTSLKASYR